MYNTTKKESITEKISIKLSGYKAATISENPYKIEITFKPKFTKHPVFKQWIYTFIEKLEENIKKENIVKDVDYTISVI